MSDNKIISPSVINPIDYFNRNNVQWLFEYMLTRRNVQQTSISSLTYVENRSDATKKMIVIENNNFVAKMKNGLGMEIDKPYSPFMMLQKFMFKDKFTPSLYFVMNEIMNNPNDFIRVGTKYFKSIEKIDQNGIKRETLKLWDKQTLVDDYGGKILDEVEKYDDFTIQPDNLNYQKVIGNNYNLYKEFSHKPCDKENYEDEMQFYWIKNLIEHIFGEQYELGIKYMKVLYCLPKQKLPILVLTSKERSTGKTTFIDFLDMLFGDNSVIINPENISNQFNSSYSDKNVIMIEESKFENDQAIEKLKNLSTQKKMLVNPKFIQPYSIPFYGRVIMTSNNENKFSRVDDSEIRYWVRKIPSLKNKSNHNILNDMKNEIPYFLYYLNSLPDIDTSKSRMVFSPDDLDTNALKRVKKESLPALHKDIYLLLDDHCANNTDIEYFEFIAQDIKKRFYQNDSRINMDYINKILKESMKLKRVKMKRYTPIDSNAFNKKKRSGRPFIYKNKYYEHKEI